MPARFVTDRKHAAGMEEEKNYPSFLIKGCSAILGPI